MKVLDFPQFMDGQRLAADIGNTWRKWKTARNSWETDVQELRNYIFATSTRDTENARLPWRNSTTLPKITQIRDNLQVNYIDTLFPNDNWLFWLSSTREASKKETREFIEAFMKNRLRESGFESTMEQLVLDYIDYGNAFAGVTFVDESYVEETTGKTIPGYRGPKLYRISPYDIVFDPTASSFKNTPKIVRSIKSLGQLEKEALHNPNLEYNKDIIKLMKDKRATFSTMRQGYQKRKINAFAIDGFSSITHYFNSGQVEILEFEGDIYDEDSGELLEHRLITVVDRCYVIRNIPMYSEGSTGTKFHVGWRKRPDNLYSQGPLDKLVGMQYRIDHLENLKADAFDQIAYPQRKIKGEVNEFDNVPGTDIYIGDEGDVTYLHPPVEVLQADTQIMELERKMEEYAGAPKEAMGIRTPGEKTAYEVQRLENAASRLFQSKIKAFERTFLEPIVNAMFIIARDNMQATSTITESIFDQTEKVLKFYDIKQADIQGDGTLYPRGARHYAEISKMVQELNQFYQSAVAQDPDVKVHISGLKLAELMEELLRLKHFGIVEPNIRISEEAQTAMMRAVAQEQVQRQMHPDVMNMSNGNSLPEGQAALVQDQQRANTPLQ